MTTPGDYSKLGRRLRECAKYVERGEFDSSIFFEAMTELQNYANEHKEEKNKSASSGKVGLIGKRLGKMSLNAKKERQRGTTQSSSADTKEDDAKQAGEQLDKMDKQHDDDNWNSWWKASESQDENVPAKAMPGKPTFQRPSNHKSTMIANGWIEQQRRSKMRVVWKGVLVSLVKGRNSKEETTLWIQREISNATTGKRELEALHQVPMKWLEEVKFLDFYGDNRFSIKVYNVAEEFFFRCADSESAHEWVLTLRSVKDEVDKAMGKSTTTTSDNDFPEDEKTSTESSGPSTTPSTTAEKPTAPATEEKSSRKTIKELRAIAHGAGIKTHGMERSDLERVVANIDTPATTSNNGDAERRAAVEAARLRQEQEREEEALRKAAEAEKAEEDERQRQEEERRKIEEEQRQRVAEARRKAEEERRVLEEQRRAAYVAEEQRRRVAEQQAAAMAAAEQRRREEAARAQQHYQQQQQQWQQQQAAQQQWQQQQRAAAEAQQRAAQQAQWDQWRQQQQQHHQQYPQQQQQAQNPNTANGNHQQQAGGAQANEQTSTADLKYTKMAAEKGQGDEEKITAVKQNILVHWALQPPALQHLRPITDLITNIHSVFPPAFGVAGHDYFKKWKALAKEDLTPVGSASPDQEKLKKAVRKLRFFLHPDKLPRDLDEEQTFTCKMLWDISADAWEEFKKRHDELDWIQK
mmetsp:Transcript_425/g.607  ORF Transcript_425/g.607 Transcript_425/m.607 type:complete len:695 (-) Transcript_425:1931-4015(-)|eukprot:CAMPEP_0194221188 /NCGR_PEP_ID=MMETSP0156-20130528/30064_1 /TAXON_ID=33649 /ORGANISM="Thalassionema nitzschioides, Strain L26-B" /LENGTH=694 /DNA_ID=CAMNT_0038951503 /DNA_START=109 /DNA_END=2193 /DNA_ORIENTATION=+